MEQNLQDKLTKMKQDIRDLKTAHDLRSNMKTFHAQITTPDYQDYNTIRIRLTYADGTQPILTTITGDRHIIPLEPNGNVQDFVLAEKKGNLIWSMTVYFLSTRKIENIQIV